MSKHEEYQKKMTSKEALLNLDENGCGYLLSFRLFKQIKQDLERLEKLTYQPTLEEVKKEWEELGYEWIEKLYTDSIVLKKTVAEPWLGNDTYTITYFISISINVINKTYRAEKRSCFACEGKELTLEEHQLITKTIQALGGIKNGF